MSASIYVFEDGELRDSYCSSVQGSIRNHLEKNHAKTWHGQFDWHSKWNCSNNTGTTINSDELYNEALDFCRNSPLSGIVFFDFVFKEYEDGPILSVTDTHIAKVFSGLLPKGITKQEFVEHPGCLLAFAIVQNKKADVDIYLSTANGNARINAINAMRALNKRVVVESFGDSILKAANKKTLSTDLLPLVDRYIQERTGEPILQNLFWPEESLVWFKKGKNESKSPGDIPHNCDDFKELYDTLESRLSSPLGIYLRRIAGFSTAANSVFDDQYWLDSLTTEVKQLIDSFVEDWLTNEDIYRTMELFVGHHSMLGNGSERPSLSAFALPLVAALGTKQICTNIASQATAKFAWIDKKQTGGSRNFGSDDQDATKAIFVKACLLFLELANCCDKAFVEATSTFDFLMLELDINSTIRSSRNGTPPPRHPLLTLTQFRADEQDSGTMRAYNAFQDACRPKSSAQDRALFAWFLPGSTCDKTLLKIGVAKRD